MPAPGIVVAAGAVVLDHHGRLLVIQRGHEPAAGRWSLPGGRVEPGEPAAAAAAREVAEETGLEVDVGDLVGLTEVFGEGTHLLILDFEATVTGGTVAAGDDAADVAWVTRAELEDRPTTDGLVTFLDTHGVVLAP